MWRLGKGTDCRACFLIDCNYECKTCSKMRKEREDGIRTSEQDLKENIEDAIKRKVIE